MTSSEILYLKYYVSLKTYLLYLFIEMFNDYPEEKEFLLIWCSYFKILSIEDFYYATK